MHWWNREFSRQGLALVLTPLCLLVPGTTLVRYLAAWGLYAAGYLLLTWLTFRGHGPAELRTVALAARGKHHTNRWFTVAPEQVSQVGAVAALFATVAVLPRARAQDAPPAVVIGICAVAIVGAWLAVQAGFVLKYLGLYAEAGGLEFPGDDEPRLVDFAYFAVAVGTTFGTTDVTVTQSRLRRQVLAHGVLAFVFNTLIIASAITFMTSYIATP